MIRIKALLFFVIVILVFGGFVFPAQAQVSIGDNGDVTVSGQLHFQSGLVVPLRKANTNTTLLETDFIVYTDVGDKTYTLPLASSAGAGRRYIVYSTDETNSVTLATSGSDEIFDMWFGTADSSLAVFSAELVSDGVDQWVMIIGVE